MRLSTLTTAIALAAHAPLGVAIALDPDPGSPQTLSDSFLSRVADAVAKILPMGICTLPIPGSISNKPPATQDNPNPNPERRDVPPPHSRAPVDWDKNSLLILGMREMLFGGEFHPFRLPVPSLWWDVLEKMRAAGLNTVSFKTMWALHEGKPGHFTADGIFSLEPLFLAAKEIGMWLIARPGPYINSEVSGGGMPGWIQRLVGHPRTADQDYLAASNTYAPAIAGVISRAQVANGGRVLLYQPENSYSLGVKLNGFNFPDPGYMQFVENQARDNGIVVPFINNDGSWSSGNNEPGTGVGQVDIYGSTMYPLDADCSDLEWKGGGMRTMDYKWHLNISPSTPHAITEYQAGEFDFWGAQGYDVCAARVNHEYSRIFYKNQYAAGVTLLNFNMIFGGTNWGNLGYDSGYTSYDYAAVIAEDRTITRESYSELKLQTNFINVFQGYLNATPDMNYTIGVYSPNVDLAVTAVTGTGGSMYVVRHDDWRSRNSVSYTLSLKTSRGQQTIPHLGGELTLPGRDSKIHVTDFPVGDSKLVYCTAEIFTWQKFENKTVLVVYGGMDETHELLVNRNPLEMVFTVAGPGVKLQPEGSLLYTQWRVSGSRQFIRVGNLYIYLLDRNSAYNYWTTKIDDSSTSLIINGGYLIRSASLSDSALSLRADFNRSTTIEIMGVPSSASSLYVNGAAVQYQIGTDGNWFAQIDYQPPTINLPDLSKLDWKYIDSMPEVQPGYDDSAWVNADRTTNNTFFQPPLTEHSLYAADYGFHTGSLIFRGHFIATGAETGLDIVTQGGQSHASSLWLNETFLGGWPGKPNWILNKTMLHQDTYSMAGLKAGQPYVLTVLIDNMGLAQNALIGADLMKQPRGIMQYRFYTAWGDGASINWKVQGNLGGEDYADKFRGPLNEGGLYAERQGYHLPGPPTDRFSAGSPYKGIDKAGVGFYTATFNLDLPNDKWDIPLRFEFPKIDKVGSGNYRAFLYINGFNFGRYIAHIGPQTSFPVPEGILNYRGQNTIAVALWAPRPDGARISPLRLTAGNPVLTGRKPVEVVDAPGWGQRWGAY